MNLMDNLIHMSNTQKFYTRKINIAIIGAGRVWKFSSSKSITIQVPILI